MWGIEFTSESFDYYSKLALAYVNQETIDSN